MVGVVVDSETVGVCLGLIEKKKKNSSATSARSGTEAMYAAACLIQVPITTIFRCPLMILDVFRCTM